MRTNIGKEGKKDHIQARTHELRQFGYTFKQTVTFLFINLCL